MAGGLAKEIKQSKSFPSLEGESALNILRTAEVVLHKFNIVMKDFDLTFTQYNVLRILRGAGEQGLTCSQLGERMITQDPDITRLLDRMERRTLVLRQRSSEDRRIVMTKIGPDGLALLSEADEPLRKMLTATMGKLGKDKLTSLVELMEEVRSRYV